MHSSYKDDVLTVELQAQSEGIIPKVPQEYEVPRASQV